MKISGLFSHLRHWKDLLCEESFEELENKSCYVEEFEAIAIDWPANCTWHVEDQNKEPECICVQEEMIKEFKDTSSNQQCSTVQQSLVMHFSPLASKLRLETLKELIEQPTCCDKPLITRHKQNFENQTAYGGNALMGMPGIGKAKLRVLDDLRNFYSHMVITQYSKTQAMFLLATLFMMGTFVAASRYAGIDEEPQEKQNSVVTRSFILCNSAVFVTSSAGVIYLLHEFPYKPWPHITVLMLFGSYMLLVFKISPNEALPLFLLSIPVLLLAAAGKLFGFARERLFFGS